MDPKRYLPSERWHTLAPPGDGRAQAVDLWLFPLGGGGFVPPAAEPRSRWLLSEQAPQQQPHGSQRASTRPRRPGCTSSQTLTSCNAGHARGAHRRFLLPCVLSDTLICNLFRSLAIPDRDGSSTSRFPRSSRRLLSPTRRLWPELRWWHCQPHGPLRLARDLTVSDVAKVCAVWNTPKHEFALSPGEAFAWALPSGRSAVPRLTTPRSSQSS